MGDPATANAATTSDADNMPLALTVSSPANFSEGCGLDQTLSYSWALSVPTDSGASLSSTGATTNFIPDKAGSYDVQLSVNDGTTSGANGDGTASETLSYTATP